MKSICITGAPLTALEGIAHILQKAGMKPAVPAQRNDSMDIRLWHEKVLASAPEGGGLPQQQVSQPGRLWEQLAGDIFLANMDAPVWGWADPRSTWLLEFWLNFEPNLSFILACASPEQMLAEAMSGEKPAANAAGILETWEAHHREMLRFHHRHPERSLLVDALDCAANPRGLAERCMERWKLNLTPADARPDSAPTPDPLALYLARQLCKEAPGPEGLQQEIAATVIHLGPAGKESRPTTLSPNEIVASYRALRDRSDEIAALTNAHRAELQSQQKKLKEAEQENELLLLQLHQVQEELEHYFLKHQELERQQQKSEARWWRQMLNYDPAYCECESIEALPSGSGKGPLRWRLTQLAVVGRTLPTLEFKTFLEQGTLGLVFDKSTAASHFTRLPSAASKETELVLCTAGGTREVAATRLNILLDMATNDWEFLLALLKLIRHALENSMVALPAEQKDALRAGLEKLAEAMNKLSAHFVRYDRATLKRQESDADRESLRLSLENFAYNGKRWPSFEFRFVSDHVGTHGFGARPRIELQKDAGRDHALGMALSERLPFIFATLGNSGVSPNRPWSEWTEAARELHKKFARDAKTLKAK